MITCLNTSKERFDGERIKNTLIYDSLKKYADLDVINLSKNKIINTVRIFFKSMFGKHKYENIIISKDSHGANIIQRIAIDLEIGTGLSIYILICGILLLYLFKKGNKEFNKINV